MPYLRATSFKSYTPQEVIQKRQRGEVFVLLDVREPDEVAVEAVDWALKIPMQDVPASLSQFNPATEIIVMCRSGRRSSHVAVWLAGQGFQVANLRGGLETWKDIDKSGISH